MRADGLGLLAAPRGVRRSVRPPGRVHFRRRRRRERLERGRGGRSLHDAELQRRRLTDGLTDRLGRAIAGSCRADEERESCTPTPGASAEETGSAFAAAASPPARPSLLGHLLLLRLLLPPRGARRAAVTVKPWAGSGEGKLLSRFTNHAPSRDWLPRRRGRALCNNRQSRLGGGRGGAWPLRACVSPHGIGRPRRRGRALGADAQR